MKKLILISLISILFLGSKASAEIIRNDNFYNNDTLEQMEQEFFENGIVTQKQDNEDGEFRDYSASFGGGDPGIRRFKGMTLFKKCRIKIQNYYKIKEHEEQLKEQAQMEQELDAFNKKMQSLDDDELDELTSRSLNKIYKDEDGNEVKVSGFEKFKNVFKFSKKSNKEEDESINNTESSVNIENKSESDTLSGGVREVVAEKDMILDCDKLNYDDETSELEAVGNPIMSFPPQNVTIKAKRLTYNTEGNIIKAYDDVEITKSGQTIYGDYVMIDLNDESSIVTNMHTNKMNMLVNAKDVVASEDSIELKEGSITGDKHYILVLKSNMVGARLENFEIPEDEYSSLSKDGLDIKIKAKEIYVTAKKNHDIFTVKDADIYFKDNYVTRWRSFTAHTNKNQEYFEANYPEFGNIPRIGMFAGPGFVFDVPNGATLKFIPFINYKSKWGIGAALKYRSGTNYTEMYYGSANDMFVLRGRQGLDDRLYLQYGVNSYLDEWWLGSGLAKYRVEAVYRDSYTIPNTLGEGRSAAFRQRISAGYLQDANFNRKGEHLGDGKMGTTRFKYMTELSQNLYNYRNKDKNINLNLSWLFQGSAALYGTGDTQFIARTGPMLHSQYKRWVQDIGYFLTGKHDETPVPKIDTYRLGRSSVFIRESIRLNKYLTASWLASSALSNDAPNHKTFQENGFYFSIGPDDLKIILGYDFIRERSYFLFSTALDLKGTHVDYKKMVIKNPDKLSKDDSEKVEPITFDSRPAKVRKTHAQVIDIEDPDREQL